MNILYDGHIFRWQRVGGIIRYFREIITRLPADWTPELVAVPPDITTLPPHPRLAYSPLSSVIPRRFTQPLKTSWWKNQQARRADIFHPTYYTLASGLDFADFTCPIVVTAHDFIAGRHPQLEPNSAVTIRAQKNAFARAAHVVCISKFTQNDLLSFYPHLEGKTSVIYHGSSFPVSPTLPGDSIFEQPTFLYVGGRNTYKNFPFLLRAFARACQSHPKIRLHLAGPALNADELWQIHFLGISDRVDASSIPGEEALYNLYRTSIGLLYPSRFEGFGIPPLEAMACGTLPITSNATSVPEVLGPAGIMLDPSDENAWTDCILAVANGKVPRRELLDVGSKRARELSWDASAQRHVEVYKQLI